MTTINFREVKIYLEGSGERVSVSYLMRGVTHRAEGFTLQEAISNLQDKLKKRNENIQ